MAQLGTSPRVPEGQSLEVLSAVVLDRGLWGGQTSCALGHEQADAGVALGVAAREKVVVRLERMLLPETLFG